MIFKLFYLQRSQNGAWLENKTHSLTFHFRSVPEEKQEELRLKAKAIVESHGYKANPAHCAIEAKPPVQWNKGNKGNNHN